MIDELMGINGATQAMEISRTALYERIRRGVFPKPIPSDLKRVYWLSHEVRAIVKAMRSGSSDDELGKVVQIIYECREQGLEDARKIASPAAVCARNILPINGYVSVQGICDKYRRSLGLDGGDYAYGRVVRGSPIGSAHDDSGSVVEKDAFVAFKKEHGLRFISGLKDYLLVRECDLIAILEV